MLFAFYLDSIGDGSGSPDAVTDGSVTPKPYTLAAPRGSQLRISQLSCHIRDRGNMAVQKYGGINELPNGIVIEVERGGRSVDLTNGQPIKSIADWARLAHDADLMDQGSGDKVWKIRWGMNLVLQPAARLTVYVRDDLTGLKGHSFMAQGQGEFAGISSQRLIGV